MKSKDDVFGGFYGRYSNSQMPSADPDLVVPFLRAALCLAVVVVSGLPCNFASRHTAPPCTYASFMSGGFLDSPLVGKQGCFSNFQYYSIRFHMS